MILRAKAMLVAMLLASPLVVAPPVWAGTGGSGGASPGGASAGAPSADASPQTAAPGAGSGGAPDAGGAPLIEDPLATATGDGITVTTDDSALLGRHLAFEGITSPASVGETIVVQRLDPTAGWVSVASGTVDTGGTFSILWRTNYVGRMAVRTVLGETATASSTGLTAPTLLITVYRPALATFYGRGFFGQKTACGQTLRRTSLGVASRTLKCGTQVQIYYGGRTIVVPVIDRGPYANHASWDLTQATAHALGITGTETIGVMAG